MGGTVLLAPLEKGVNDGDQGVPSNNAFFLRLGHEPVKLVERSGFIGAEVVADAVESNAPAAAGLPVPGFGMSGHEKTSKPEPRKPPLQA